MPVTSRQCSLVSLLLLALALPGLSHAAAGRVESLKGTAQVRSGDGAWRKLERDGQFVNGDEIRVDGGARAGLRFVDESLVELGPNSRMRVENVNYVKERAEESSFFTRVLNGTFRVVTGLVAKQNPRRTKYTTAVATIGIRGTHFIGEVDEQAQ